MEPNIDTIEFEDIDITDNKYVEEITFALRRTRLIVTIADPLIQTVDLQKLMEMGMNVIRLKTSHCTEIDRINMIGRIDKATKFLARKYGLLEWPCATCVELKTGVLQTGLLKEDVEKILIETNTEVYLTTDISKFDKCNNNEIFVDDPYLTNDVQVGMVLNISQDEIILECIAREETSLKCTVTKGGNLKNMAYVCMRGGRRSHPYISQKDLHLLQFAMEYRVDMIIVNYPRNIETLLKIKKCIGSNVAKRPMLIAGISTQTGLINIDDFVAVADGILLSREFMPFEVDAPLYNRMGLIQSYMAAKCRQAGKPFYISGQVFQEALLTGSLCTRDISDVTNALLQGTSGFVLSHCNDINLMCDAMKMINDVCTSVEPLYVNKTDFWHLLSEIKMPVNAAEASAMSCAVAANQTNARVIILPTVSGRTAYLLNWLQPNSIIIGVSTKVRTVRLLKMYRSLVPLLYKGPPRRRWFDTVQARVTFALQHAIEQKWIDCGDSYISLEKATEESSFCDAVRIWNVTENSKRNKIECPESYHDFDVNTFTEPTTSNIKKEREPTEKMVTKVVENEHSKEKESNGEATKEDPGKSVERKNAEEVKIVKQSKELKKEQKSKKEEVAGVEKDNHRKHEYCEEAKEKNGKIKKEEEKPIDNSEDKH